MTLKKNRLLKALKKNHLDRKPFFVYFEQDLENNLTTYRHYFKKLFSNKDISFSFSLKSQPNYKVIQFFNQQKLHFDVSSFSELDYALRMGIPPQNISLEGVGVDYQALDLAIDSQIGSVHLDNVDALKYYFSKSPSEKIKVTVRFIYESLQSKIGFTAQELLELKDITLDGLHVYLGRETYSLDKIKKALQEVQSVFCERSLFCQTPHLFLGPGVPDLGLFNSFQKIETISFPYPIHIEAGRALCSSAGYYGVPVLSVKQTHSEQCLVTVDGGLQHLGSPWVTLKSGPLDFDPLFFDDQLKEIDAPPFVEALIYGSLCLWHDCLHPRLKVPSCLKRDDWILVPNMGAYGLTAGVPLFIGESLPCEYYDDKVNLLDVTHSQFKSYLKGF